MPGRFWKLKKSAKKPLLMKSIRERTDIPLVPSLTSEVSKSIE